MKRVRALPILLCFLLASSLLPVSCLPTPPAEPTVTSPVSVAPTDTPSVASETPIAPSESPAASPLVPTAPATTGEEEALVFASFNVPPVSPEAVIQHPAIAPDLSNVANPFLLSHAQLKRLVHDGFVVSPGDEKEFFSLYERARYDNLPIFVTTDSLLHTYHLLFSKVLRTAEVEHFIPLLRNLNAAVLSRADDLRWALDGTDWDSAAQQMVAFVGVGSRLLDADAEIPAYAADLGEEQLALIQDPSGIAASPVFPTLEHGEDYTQYIPRGHYTKSEALGAYFRAMMWYGRMTFRLRTRDPEVGRAETRSALLLVHALRTTEVDGHPALEVWADIYSPTVFFVGRSDDLTVLQYGRLMQEIYGPSATVEDLTDEALLGEFISEASELPAPRILGLVISELDDVEEETKGLRFMGQRFVPDAYIFRELMYRNVGSARPPERRGLPSGLDIPAAMGSNRAYQILTELGETDYENYPEQMGNMQQWLSGLGIADWTETLYNAWLYSFRPLLDEPGNGYPAFMQSTAWLDKQLNTVLGSWAELKHDTILYAKQAYAELGGGPPPPPPPPAAARGYVEPVPEFYARLVALTSLTREGLRTRGLLAREDDDSLRRLDRLARSLQVIAEKQLRGEPLTEDEHELIRFYGGELEHLTMAAADKSDDDLGIGGSIMPEEDPQAAVIADVATDPDPAGDGSARASVLEVGVGRIDHLHAVVPLIEEDGSITLQVARGGVLSYYEFPWPAEDRLTDEAWREMLERGEAPPRPAWIGSFFTEEGEYEELRRSIFRFRESLVSAFWYLNPRQLFCGEDLRLQMTSEIEALKQAGRYESRGMQDIAFCSFDRQAADLAVVTVRETWEDALYQLQGDEPGYDEMPTSRRGPYTLDVTYTLERDGTGHWLVTRAVYSDHPPEWQQRRADRRIGSGVSGNGLLPATVTPDWTVVSSSHLRYSHLHTMHLHHSPDGSSGVEPDRGGDG